jgi:hypothetical protein
MALPVMTGRIVSGIALLNGMNSTDKRWNIKLEPASIFAPFA